VARLTPLLKEKDVYDKATNILGGDHGDVDAGPALDEPALHIPLVIKQPDSDGAGRRVPVPVQQIDLLPTLLDLVRAPIPGGLRGRSLRPVLDDDESMPALPIYSESLAAYYRFGGMPLYAITGEHSRLVRGASDRFVAIASPAGSSKAADQASLSAVLDRLLGSRPIDAPSPIPAAEQDRYARAGYLLGMAPAAVEPALDPVTQQAVSAAHRAAARLIGDKKYAAGLGILQAIVRDHPALAMVHYQIASLLMRSGRLEEAIAPLTRAAELQPDAADVPAALAAVLLRTGRLDEAQAQADLAVATADKHDTRSVAAAHEVAARVALARRDPDAATAHAAAVLAADPALPMPQFVRGKLLFDEGQYEMAATALEDGAAVLKEHGGTLPSLHLLLGEALSHLERYPEAEMEFREELRAFPDNIQAYSSLALLYHASNRDEAVAAVLDHLVEAAPTPAGYSAAARLWTVIGDRSRAEAVRGDARARFKGDPSLAPLGGDGHR
jgi:tetratricopeptide (TPR) repeat protein